VGATYGLTLLEKACLLVYPMLTGIAVDNLLKQQYQGLFALVSVWLLRLGITFFRQRYDTRVFMGIYAKIATHTAISQQQRGHTLSRISGRVELVRDIVNFFEYEIPAVFHNIVSVVGSLVMLFIYDVEAGLIALGVLLPMTLANAWYWRKALRVNKALNNQIEREVAIIETQRSSAISRHFGLLSRWRVALSDSHANTWVITEAATVFALIFILLDFTQSPGFSAGAIYAVLAYTHDYLMGLNDAPNVVNNIARLKDVQQRLKD
jgi:ABC-type bacteriocin/lantibiotic exporter with double-glycine peptidase domain